MKFGKKFTVVGIILTMTVAALFMVPGAVMAQEKIQKVTFADAETYEPRGHFNMTAAALHNEALGRSKGFIVALSTFEPGGGAESNKKPSESVYFVLEGEMTVTTPDGDIKLGPNESVYRPANVECGLINNSKKPVKMLVIGLPRQAGAAKGPAPQK